MQSWQRSCVLKGGLPGLVLREAAQFEDVEHEVSSVDVLHDKEEVVPRLEARVQASQEGRLPL